MSLYFKGGSQFFSLTLTSLICKFCIIALGIRAEYKIPLMNFLTCKDYIENSLLNKSYYAVASDKIKNLMSECLKDLFDIIALNKSPHTLDTISRSVLAEQAFFEYYVRGGSNLNILPKTAKIFFNQFSTEYNINPLPSISQYTFTESENDIMLNKLVKYTKSISKNVKDKIYSLLNFIKIRDLDQQINLLVSTFKEEISTLNNFHESCYSLGSKKKSKKPANPISMPEFYHSFFTSPERIISFSKYIGYFSYLRVVHSDGFLKNKIVSELNNRIIKFIPFRITKNSIVVREIIYESSILDKDLKEKIKIVRDSIILGFNSYENSTASNNQRFKIRKREPDVSISEFGLIYYGLFKDSYINEQKIKLINDLRYPFWTYCAQGRINSGYRTLLSKIENGLDIENIIKEFNINNFTIVSLVLFLNMNKRSFINKSSVEVADELLNFGNGFECFIKKSKDFYQSIFINQRDYSGNTKLSDALFQNNLNLINELYINETSDRIDIIIESTTSLSQDEENLFNYTENILIVESSSVSENEKDEYLSNHNVETENVFDNFKTYSQNNTINNEFFNIENEYVLNILKKKNIYDHAIPELCKRIRITENSKNHPVKKNHSVLSLYHTAENKNLQYPSTVMLMLPEPRNHVNKDESIFYEYIDGQFHLKQQGQEVILILKNSTKKKYILLKLSKKSLESKNFKYEEVVNFLNVLESEKAIEKKNKPNTFIFRFTEDVLEY